MEQIIISIINKYGYMGIALLIAVENIFPPIPSEVILTFGGFATTISKITVTGTIVYATIGSVIGAIILYWIGRALNEERIEKIADSKLGKALGIKKENIHKSFIWFDNKGKYAVFIGRFVPIIRSLVSIPAGMAKMPIAPFLILTTVGSIIWNTVLIVLGKIAGASWSKVAKYVGEYSSVILAILIVLLAIGIIGFYAKKSKIITVIKLGNKKKKTEK